MVIWQTAWKAYNIRKEEVIPHEKCSGTRTKLEDISLPVTLEGTIKADKSKSANGTFEEKVKKKKKKKDSANAENLDGNLTGGVLNSYVFRKGVLKYIFHYLFIYCFGEPYSCRKTWTWYTKGIFIRHCEEKNNWTDMCINLNSDQTVIISDRAQETVTSSMGWALKKETRQCRFTSNVKYYLNEIFHDDEISNRKASLVDVSSAKR